MKKIKLKLRKGLSLVEVVTSVALLVLISAFVLNTLAYNYRIMGRTRNFTARSSSIMGTIEERALSARATGSGHGGAGEDGMSLNIWGASMPILRLENFFENKHLRGGGASVVTMTAFVSATWEGEYIQPPDTPPTPPTNVPVFTTNAINPFWLGAPREDRFIRIEGGTPPYTVSITDNSGNVAGGKLRGIHSSLSLENRNPTTWSIYGAIDEHTSNNTYDAEFTLKVEDSLGKSSTKIFGYQTVTIAPAAWSGAIGQSVNGQLELTSAATPGDVNTLPYNGIVADRWTVSTGAPEGITISESGSISGTYTGSARSYNFTVTGIIDSGPWAGKRASRTISVQVHANAGGGLTIVNDKFTDGMVGQHYEMKLEAINGSGSYWWEVSGLESLPSQNGFEVSPHPHDPSAGRVYGIPTETFADRMLTVRVLDQLEFNPDGSNKSATRTIPFTVRNPGDDLEITTINLPNAIVGQPYSFQLRAKGGSGTYVQWWNAASSRYSMPDWMTLNESTGILTGTPQAGDVTENLQIGMAVRDSAGNERQGYVYINIRQPGADSFTVLNRITNTVQWEQTRTGSTFYAELAPLDGYTMPHVITVTRSRPGQPNLILTFDTHYRYEYLRSNPRLRGITINSGIAAGDIITITGDATGDGGDDGGMLRIVTETLPDATVNAPYSFTLQAAGGLPPYEWSTLGKYPLPDWLKLNRTTGVISGTPPEAKVETIAFKVNDQSVVGINEATKYITLTINPPESVSSFGVSNTVTNTVSWFARVQQGGEFTGAIVANDGYYLPSSVGVTLHNPGGGTRTLSSNEYTYDAGDDKVGSITISSVLGNITITGVAPKDTSELFTLRNQITNTVHWSEERSGDIIHGEMEPSSGFKKPDQITVTRSRPGTADVTLSRDTHYSYYPLRRDTRLSGITITSGVMPGDTVTITGAAVKDPTAVPSTFGVSNTITNTVSWIAQVQEGTGFTRSIAANNGYTLPSSVNVTLQNPGGGTRKLSSNEYTYSAGDGKTGSITIQASAVVGNITITGTAAAAIIPAITV
jgi:hypothetical protein